MSESILERVQADTRTAMKAGERDRVNTLRMIASSLQQDEKEGEGDPVAVLQRERRPPKRSPTPGAPSRPRPSAPRRR
jgi:hypothetical protein